MAKLSILIPSRCEEWLAQTVKGILENIEEDTEVIVGLDGAWAEPGIPDDPRVTIVYYPQSIGQRGMTNQLCKLSKAKYVMKCDAHVAFDKGFDRKMIEKMEDDITMVGVMRNLHVFDWECQNCQMRTYQGPQPEQCRNEECANIEQKFEKRLVWNPKTNPQSSAYRFNKNLQFKYFPELRSRQPRTGLAETMSLQGSCFMLTREKYWELNICDESWGSWGQQGTEVAVKTWLSGGRVLVNMDTWYAHLFRTQHGFSFPYPMSGHDQEKARKISQQLFLTDSWDKAIHPMSWLLEKFWFALKDVQDTEARWELSDIQGLKKEPTKGIIYYTAHMKPIKLASKVQRNLLRISGDFAIPITSCSLKPMPKMGKNVQLRMKPGSMTMFKQILAALEASTADIVYFCEDDVLYHPSHFDFTPKETDKFYYNINWWRVRDDGFAARWDANQVSGLVTYRQHALEYYRKRIAEIESRGFNRSYEPGGRDPKQYEQFRSQSPNIDYRPKGTLTKSKWSLDDFKDKSTAQGFETSTIDKIPGWVLEQLL